MKPVVMIILCIMLAALLLGCSAAETNPPDTEPSEPEISATISPAPGEPEPSEDADFDPEPEPEPEQPPDPDPEPDPPEPQAPDSIAEVTRGLFPFSFTAADLYGNTVSEETMGEKEVFLVYLWATWCPSCVRAMPYKTELVRLFGDRVGFIGLLDDFSTNQSGALSIAEAVELPPEFINIDIWDTPELLELIAMMNVEFIPASVVLTPDGVMSRPLIGGSLEQYIELIESMLG